MDVHGSGSRSEEQVPSGGGQLPVDGVALFGLTHGQGATNERPCINPLCRYFLVTRPGGCEKLIGTCGAVHPCRVKTFSKSRVRGYGRLCDGLATIDNMNEILKLVDNECWNNLRWLILQHEMLNGSVVKGCLLDGIERGDPSNLSYYNT